jgi:hypothetical protein
MGILLIRMELAVELVLAAVVVQSLPVQQVVL